VGNPYAPPGENQRPPERPPTTTGGPAGPGHAGDDRRAGGPGRGPGDGHGPLGGPPGGPPPDGRGPQGPGHGLPPERRPLPAPDSPIMKATSRRVLHFLALLLAAVVTSGLPLPWQAASLVFLVAGLVVGIRAFVLALRGGVRGGLAVMLGVGVAMAGFVGLGMLSLLALWPQQLERQECLAGAVTISATRACEAEFSRSVDERLGRTSPTEAP